MSNLSVGILQVSFEVTVVSAKARGLSEGRPEVSSDCDSSEKSALKSYLYCHVTLGGYPTVVWGNHARERHKQRFVYYFNTLNEIVQLEL